jgi:hypothetical protein
MAIGKDPIENWKWSEHMTRNAEEAVSELEREAQVRKRCFDRWVTDGRLSYTDARDRQERLLSAIGLLRRMESGGIEETGENETQAMIQELERKGWLVKPPVIPWPESIAAGLAQAHQAVDAASDNDGNIDA